MIFHINEYLERNNIRITKENLYNEKKTIINDLIEDELQNTFIHKTCKDSKADVYVYIQTQNNENIKKHNKYKIEDVNSCCIIREFSNRKGVKIYGLILMCVRKSMQRKGLGTILFHDVYDKILNRTKKTKQITRIYTHAVEDSIDFYRKLGFIETQRNNECDMLYKYEDLDEEDTIMVYEREI